MRSRTVSFDNKPRPRNARRKSPSLVRMIEIFGSAHALPLAKAIAGALRAQDSRRLKQYKDALGSPQLYRDPHTYKTNAALLALFSKCGDYVAANAEDTAFATFKTSCSRMTFVNRNIDEGRLTSETQRILTKAFGFIRENYRFESADDLWEEIVRCAKHGPGSSLEVTGKATHFAYKDASGLKGGTRWAVNAYLFDEFSVGKDCTETLNVVSYNAGTFVPKNMWTERMIAIEPGLNMYYQLGLAQLLRSRMLATGVDLERGQYYNRWLSRAASLNGEYCTVDITSASDSISLALVRNLFRYSSPALYEAMCLLRSPVMYLEACGATHEVQLPMFSTMGNGYTFPLETIVFQSLIEATMERYGVYFPYLVYGDDIIVHKSVVYPLMNVLSELGMVPNVDKTFTRGPFRESCGSDWWEGIDVRPVFVKSLNGLSLYALRNLMSLDPIYESLVDYLDPFMRHWGPQVQMGSEDGVGRESATVGLDSFYMPGWAWTDDAEKHTRRWDRHTHTWTYKELGVHTPDFREEDFENLDLTHVLYEHALKGAWGSDPATVERRRTSSLHSRWTHLHGRSE